RTVAIARGKDKEPLSRRLGAHHYIDSEAQDPAEALQKLGGARVILATVTSGKAMSASVGGLAVGGKLVVLGAADVPLEVSAFVPSMDRPSWPRAPCSRSRRRCFPPGAPRRSLRRRRCGCSERHKPLVLGLSSAGENAGRHENVRLRRLR